MTGTTENGYASREQLLSPCERRYTDVSIDGLGRVMIRNLTELERSKLELGNFTRKGSLNLEKYGDFKCRLIVACVVDPTIKSPLLSNADVADLRVKDSRITNELADAIAEHCGFSPSDLENIEKNSERRPADASPSS